MRALAAMAIGGEGQVSLGAARLDDLDACVLKDLAHGLGLGTHKWNPQARHPWVKECEAWLREQKFAK